MTRLAPIFCLFALAGCCEHVVLPTPAPNITPQQQRVATFTQFVPVSDSKITTCTQRGGCDTHEFIGLANGLQIHYPEDLLPLVKPDSATARNTAEADHDENVGEGLRFGGFVGPFLGGAGYFLDRASVAWRDDRSVGAFDRDLSIAFMVGGAAAMIAGYVYHYQAVSGGARPPTPPSATTSATGSRSACPATRSCRARRRHSLRSNHRRLSRFADRLALAMPVVWSPALAHLAKADARLVPLIARGTARTGDRADDESGAEPRTRDRGAAAVGRGGGDDLGALPRDLSAQEVSEPARDPRHAAAAPARGRAVGREGGGGARPRATRARQQAAPRPRLAALDDAAVTAMLLPVRGIGPWSVDMFLMFALARPDVLPVGDLGIRKGMQRHFNLRKLPEADKMTKLAAPWRPFRSIASWYMWRTLEPDAVAA